MTLQSTFVARAPTVLCLQLVRFTNTGHKIATRVTDTAHLVVGGGAFGVPAQAYRLLATITHIGETLAAGHFIATVYRGGAWWICDDSIITGPRIIEDGRVAELHRNAYMVFLRASEDGLPPADDVEM